jgi:glycine/D-amino acid oxidase-like deaminating enzyme
MSAADAGEQKPVLIIGAGVVGLTLAHALAKVCCVTFPCASNPSVADVDPSACKLLYRLFCMTS